MNREAPNAALAPLQPARSRASPPSGAFYNLN